MSPRLNFACELESSKLTDLFADGSVVESLRALDASVTLGLVDLSAERAAVVRQLNAAGVPVTAWLLLPVDQGYWFAANNATFAEMRYGAFRAWTAEYGLVWTGVGLDVEPDLREIRSLFSGHLTVLPTLLRRVVDDRARTKAAEQYAALVARIRAEGYSVHSYEIPFIEDERRVGATLLQRILGLVDVRADRRIPMLYSSFLEPGGAGFLWSYGVGKQAIIVGSTGGGVTVGGVDLLRALDWTEFSRDLRLAGRLADDVGIFSLEGCVRQGFLSRLRAFAWDEPIEPPLAEAATIDRWRTIARGALWLSARPYLSLAVLGLVVGICWSATWSRLHQS